MTGEYTVEVHIEKLKRFILESDIMFKCPAVPDFDGGLQPEVWWENNACKICLNFIDLTASNYDPYYVDCPCQQLGCEEAVEKTINKLKEIGEL